MFRIISEPASDVVAIKINAAVTKEDFELALPQLKNKIKTEGHINLYCEIDNISSISPGALWEQLKFDVNNLNKFNRVAVIGDKSWKEWMTKFSDILTKAEIKFFNPTEKVDAMEWVINPN